MAILLHQNNLVILGLDFKKLIEEDAMEKYLEVCKNLKLNYGFLFPLVTSFYFNKLAFHKKLYCP